MRSPRLPIAQPSACWPARQARNSVRQGSVAGCRETRRATCVLKPALPPLSHSGNSSRQAGCSRMRTRTECRRDPRREAVPGFRGKGSQGSVRRRICWTPGSLANSGASLRPTRNEQFKGPLKSGTGPMRDGLWSGGEMRSKGGSRAVRGRRSSLVAVHVHVAMTEDATKPKWTSTDSPRRHRKP